MNVISINGNGFYPPPNSIIATYINPDITDCRVDAQTAVYPLTLILIGYQKTENRCYQQTFVVNNIGQLRHVYNEFTRYGSVVPADCRNELGRRMPQDWIIPSDRVTEYERVQ